MDETQAEQPSKPEIIQELLGSQDNEIEAF